MTADWVVMFTFDVDPSMETTDSWENELVTVDGSVARIPGRGVDVTAYAPGDLAMLDAAETTESEVARVVHAAPIGMEIMREPEWQRGLRPQRCPS